MLSDEIPTHALARVKYLLGLLLEIVDEKVIAMAMPKIQKLLGMLAMQRLSSRQYHEYQQNPNWI